MINPLCRGFLGNINELCFEALALGKTSIGIYRWNEKCSGNQEPPEKTIFSITMLKSKEHWVQCFATKL